jgi:predicted Zn-dependent peptidase
VAGATPASVRAAAARHLDPERLTTVVVGPGEAEKGERK